MIEYTYIRKSRLTISNLEDLAVLFTQEKSRTETKYQKEKVGNVNPVQENRETKKGNIYS